MVAAEAEPLALKLVLLLKLKVVMADTSSVVPARIEICAELLMEPFAPNASVPLLMVVVPV